VLTVDFDRLEVRAGQRVLDLGCGGGRHTYEAMRRGATVVALDYSADVVVEVRNFVNAMIAAGELPASLEGGAVNADALALPFADATFDRIIASEVLEHIWADELAISELVRILRPGGRLAVTVPTRLPERVCWALDRNYHDTPGGHIRIYRQRDLEAKLAGAGLALRGASHAHALHSPYWWLKCAVGVNDPDAWPVRKYHDFLVWQIVRQPSWLNTVDRTLNPVLGKSLVVYTERPSAPEGGNGYPVAERE
jgi:SAM-dependent methyltransferase